MRLGAVFFPFSCFTVDLFYFGYKLTDYFSSAQSVGSVIIELPFISIALIR